MTRGSHAARSCLLLVLLRKPTEADVKAVVPIFMQEQATFRRMVEILQGFESLKKIK